MSLINKMLQDLDARGGDGARAGSSPAVRPVSYGSRAGLSPAAIGAGVLALAVLGGGGFAAWKYFRGGAQTSSPPPVSRVPAAAQVQPGISPNGPAGVAVGDEGPPVVQGDIPAEAHRAAGEQLARRMKERNAAARRAAAASGKAPGQVEAGPAAEAAPQGKVRQAPERAGVGAQGKARGPDPQRASARAVASKKEAATSVVSKGSLPTGEGGDAGLSSQQKAENEYRRALAKLQDARVSEALAGLEQAVYLYPRHEAARQTLVSLLIEGGRTQEAIRHLVFATNLDPRQASMAMLLARLQLEHGGNALETLQRSLPYAESNADYRALMAGILQRANRHKEAADQYQAAVRLQPGNAVWWMGMGISLQADKRNAEAKIAFQRARDSGRLAPELQAFVERRLQQLN
jgi:MSHA biogenesis protein MshN